MINTNAIAFQRSQPNRPNGIGDIVEEHIRYWRRYEDEQKARGLTERARQQEFARKLTNKGVELYDGLTPEQTQGFLADQITQAFQGKKEELLALSMEAAQGNPQAIIKYKAMKDKFAALSKVNELYGEKGIDLEKQKSEGKYNKILDAQIDNTRNALSKGLWKLNMDDLSIDLFNKPDGTSTNIPAESLLTNDYLNASYTDPPEFKKNGLAIAKVILDTRFGEELINKDTSVRGTRLVRSLFDENNIEARSHYVLWLQENGRDPLKSKPYNDLSETEKNTVARDYYDKNVKPQIQERDLNLEGKQVFDQERLKGLRLDNKLKEEELIDKKLDREDKPKFETISVKLNPRDEAITSQNAGGLGYDIAFPKPVNYGATTNSKGIKYTSATITQDGNVIFNGVTTITEEDPNTGEIVQKNQSIATTDPRELGDIVRFIPDGKSKNSKFDNIVEFRKMAQSLFDEQVNKITAKQNNPGKAKRTITQIIQQDGVSRSEAIKIWKKEQE